MVRFTSSIFLVMSLRSNGVLISVTVFVTVVFFTAVPGSCVLNNETVVPMDKETVATMDNETRLSIEFIQMKEKEFQPGPEKEAVVILGEQNGGKSTLSLLLTNGEMKSIERGWEYNFVDENNRICDRSFCYFTLPVTDTFNNITYYDWCALEEFGNVSVEVLTSHILKKFARSDKSVKFVFVIPEYTRFDVNSVRLSDDFVDIVERASDLFVNIDKYRKAIGLVVTKSRTIRSDRETIIMAVRYLKSMRELLTNFSNSDLYGKRNYNLNGMIRFIDVLLEKKGGKYKIGVFKQPTKAGLAKELTIQQNEKIAIQSMIDNQLLFVKCDANDFGYAVAYKTKQEDLYKKLMLNLEQ